MFSKFEFFIAFRYLKSKRKEKFISITAMFSFLGIMLGVATLIVVMSVMNGFREELVGKILGVNSHISIFPKEIIDYNNIIEEIKKNSNILQINPIIDNQVMVVSGDRAVGCMAKGIQLNDLKDKHTIYDNIKTNNEIEFNNFDNSNGIIIGDYLASSLELNIDDEIKLISPEVNNTILGSIPKMKTYKIVGIFSSGMYEYDNSVVFVPFKLAQIHFNYKNTVSNIEIRLKNVDNTNKTIFELHELMKNKNIKDYYIIDWKQANSSLISALNVERNVMFLILALIILVAAFNIISSLTMMVMDKNKQIALLKTIGVSSNSILRIFFICGSIIGVVGTLLGVFFGTIFALNIENIRAFLERTFSANLFDPTVYFLTQLPSKVYTSDIIYITMMSLIISFLATIYPAKKASKTDPVEVLRYE